MKNKKTDYTYLNSYSNKDKNLNISIDSSRTADTMANSYNSDINIPLKNDIEIDIEKRNDNDVYYNSILYDDNILNFNENRIDSNNKVDNSKNSKSQYFKFKMHISLILCTIYLFLFLISMPKRLTKTNHIVTNLDLLLNENKTETIHILINDFKFSLTQNQNKNETNKNNDNTNKVWGYLLEYNYNKKYIKRWIIGFIYFAIRNLCFVFCDYQKINTNYMFKNKIDLINKLACLLFPLYLFYYDKITNTTSFVNLNNEKIKNNFIYYYIQIDRRSSWSEYIDGILPTISYFLISIIYNGIEQSIGAYLNNGKKKFSKLV